MKRYSISCAYGRDRESGKIDFHYDGRTDNVEKTIAQYEERLKRWIENVENEEYEYRKQTNDYYGIRIKDSQTKKIVYEDIHIAEEYGFKKVFHFVPTEWGGYWSGEWVKI